MKLSTLPKESIKVISEGQSSASAPLKLSQIKTGITPIETTKPVEPTSGSSSGSSSGLMAGPLSLLAVPGQLIGKTIGKFVSQPSQDKVQENVDTMRKIVDNALARADSAKTPEEKKKWIGVAQTGVEGMRTSSLAINQLQEEIQKRQRIETPIGDIPALSNDPSRALQQTVGRGAQTVALTAGKVLGPTGSGALLGFGSSFEAGASGADVLKTTSLYALGGKITGYGVGKLANTGVGQRILSSPTARVIGNILEPLGVKNANSKAGVMVDEFAQSFGKYADKAFSPSTYLKPVGNGLKIMGQNLGLAKNDQQELEAAYNKVQNYWEGAKNKYISTIKYDINSPQILAREGVIPQAKSGKMITNDAAADLGRKAMAEKHTLNDMLDSTGLYGSLDNVKRQAISNISENLKGVEREQAIAYVEKQFAALQRDYASSLITKQNGQVSLTLRDINEIKSYLWSQGYPEGLVSTSDAITARAARLAGNAAKQEINNVASAEGGDISKAITDLNERLGELFQAQKFLESMNGKSLSYGWFGRHFARIAGAVIGSQGGFVGSTAGMITADKIVSVLQDPRYTVGQAAAIIAKARQVAPEAVAQAERIIQENLQAQTSRLALPAPTTIPMGGNPNMGSTPGYPNYNLPR